MKKRTLLLADDDQLYLDTTSQALEKEGYKIITASTPEQARRLLSESIVDMALLDLRLRNNRDKHDMSGLDIARSTPPSTPKIIISDYGSIEAVRKALSIEIDGLPPAIDFVEKDKGINHLLEAIERVLYQSGNLPRSVDRLSSKLDGFFDDARSEARFMFRLSVASSSMGIIVIFVAGILGLFEELPTVLATAVAAMIMQGIAFLFFKRADDANSRRDQYHAELLRIRHFEILLNACSTLRIGQGLSARKKIIDVATLYWFNMKSNEVQSPREETETIQQSEDDNVGGMM